MSDAFHRLFRERLARGSWRDRDRPILVNNWEGTYFDFDEDRLVAIAEVARDLGIELFVLDDGWFGKRDDDHSSLGDWFVDRRKLPNGIDGLARRIEALGLRFGIWIEPEMVSERSELFAAHPDWAIAIPGRPRTEGRQQLVLDLGRPGGRRPPRAGPDRRPRERPDLLREVGHEPLDDRAVEPVARAGPPGRVQPPLHPRPVRPVRPADAAVPGHPVRVVRERRRPVRRGDARVRPAGLDERRHGRDRATGDPVGLVPRLSAELDRRPRLGRPEPPGRADHADRDPRRRRLLRRLRVRARHDGPDRGRAGGGPRPGRVLPRAPGRSSSGAASSGSAAPSRATATRRPGWACPTTAAGPSSASTGC